MPDRIKLPLPTGELLPAEERLQNVLKAIEDLILSERKNMYALLEGGDPRQAQRVRHFISGLDIAWSLAQTEILRRTDSPQ